MFKTLLLLSCLLPQGEYHKTYSSEELPYVINNLESADSSRPSNMATLGRIVKDDFDQGSENRRPWIPRPDKPDVPEVDNPDTDKQRGTPIIDFFDDLFDGSLLRNLKSAMIITIWAAFILVPLALLLYFNAFWTSGLAALLRGLAEVKKAFKELKNE